jgi:hypothetical protein
MELVKGFYKMLVNLFGSRRGLTFITATVMKMTGTLSDLYWFFIALGFISTVLLERLFKKE